MNLRRVVLDRFEMFPRVVPVSFAGLSHQVVDEDLRRTRLTDHTGDLADKEIRENAGVQRTRPNRDDVGSANCSEGFGEGNALLRFESQPADRNFGSGDLSLATHDRSVFKLRRESD